MKTPLTVSLVGVGCRVNHAETEALGRELQTRGFVLGPMSEASIVVVNTCCVTAEAQAKSRKALRRAGSLVSPERVVAFGCAASLFSQDLEGALTGVQVVRDRDGVVAAVEAVAEELTREPHPLASNATAFSLEDNHRSNECSWRCWSGGKARPNLKIQDGCDHRCRYCVVWQARGRSRSLAPAQVIAEVANAQRAGFNEVVLCGVDLGAYHTQETNLAELLQLLLERTTIGRLRLSSLEPHNLSNELIATIASSRGRIAPYLALPLQSGSEATLRRMGRPLSAAAYAERVEVARTQIPNVAIAADLICGFPGESEAEWQETMAFCKAMAFASMHVFRFSPRPHTPAQTMPGSVAPFLAKERSEEARALARRLRRAYVRRLVGSKQRVLVERPGVGSSGGLVKTLVGQQLPPRALVEVCPQAFLPPDILDAREGLLGYNG